MLYFFILGRNPELSLAELYAVLPRGYETVCVSKQVFIAECPNFDIAELIKRLGGTIKIGVVETRNAERGMRNALLGILSSTAGNKKILFGISAYGVDNKARLPTMRHLRQLGIEVKRALQKQGYKTRLVTSKDIALSSVIVEKQKLLRQGAEIVLMYGKTGDPISPQYCGEIGSPNIFIGKTLAVQEFEQASQRDYGRPVRAMEIGMLPVQLAKIMINLARAPKSATILDPFCGLGTILSEASMMGYKNLIGSDLEQKMIEATQKNLSWLKTHQQNSFCDSAESQNVQLFISPVEKLSKHLAANSVDAIVTEPYLGPTRGIQNSEFRIQNELTQLYLHAFEQFAKILKPGGRVVFIFPIFVTERRRSSLSDEILPQIKKLGFQPIPLLQKNSAFSITYSRPDQKVLREIFMFTLKKIIGKLTPPNLPKTNDL